MVSVNRRSDSPTGLRGEGRSPSCRPAGRKAVLQAAGGFLHGIALATLVFLHLLFIPGAAAGELPITDGAPPSVRLDDSVVSLGDGFVDAPVYVAGADEVDGLELSIDYDEMFLGYAFYAAESEDWSVEKVTRYGDRRVIISLRKVRASQGGKGDSKETLILRTLFVLKGEALDAGAAPPFRVDTQLYLGTPSPHPTTTGTYFYLDGDGDEKKPVETTLRSGNITIYYQDGIEIGWGALTQVEQEFSLPIYLTYLKNDRNVFGIGIDYDEVFLHVLEVRGLSPPLVNEDVDEEIDRAKGSLKFEVILENGLAGPFARLHVADIVFRFNGEHPPDDQLLITAWLTERLLLAQVPPGDADGGGGTYGQTLPGIVTILPPHFVRGNADSSTLSMGGGRLHVLPDLSDAAIILEALFRGGSNVSCYDAADANDSGVLEVTDAILLLSYFFRGGEPPPGPFPDPGMDGDDGDALDCETPLPHFEPYPR